MAVNITSPNNLSLFRVGETITFKGEADGGIVRVELFAEQYLLANITVVSSHWSAFYPFNRAGKRNIIAKGFDAANRLIASNRLDIWLIDPQVPVLGIDVSNNNPPIDWQRVKSSNISFAFIKATEGATFRDRTFATNWSGMKVAGIVRGAYHFFRPARPVQEQVSNFLQVVQNVLEPGDLPPVVDLEAWPRNTVGAEWQAISTNERINLVKNWLQQVESATREKPIIYTSPAFWEEYMGHSQDFIDYPLWIAHYTSRLAPTVPAHNWGGNGYTFWQHTESGTVTGVSGPVDRNRFNGAFDRLARLANLPVA